MKYRDKLLLIIYSLLLGLIFLRLNMNNMYINIIISSLIFIFSYISFKDNYERTRDKYGKIQNLLITSISYLIFYYLLGLLFTFEYSPYSHKLIAIFKNFIVLIVPMILQEYTRCLLINRSHNKINDILIVLIYIFINIDTNVNLINIILTVTYQVLLTYMSKTCGFKAILIYILPLQISYVIAPIFPKVNNVLLMIINVIYYIITYLIIHNPTVEHKKRKKNNYFISTICVSILVILICFICGLFRCEPITIMSNSMKPEFSRGDIVIIDKKSVQNLQVNDIIVYRMDKNRVVHRIVKIVECNNNVCYITKGDNNSSVDIGYVETSQIDGTVKFVIPKIGYPTVWLNELFR